MQVYKLNLLLTNSRYGDLEQRVIRTFVKNGRLTDFWWFADMEILLVCLLEDGLLYDAGQVRMVGGLIQKRYQLTPQGEIYVAQWPTL
jgi:hypothetical protein